MRLLVTVLLAGVASFVGAASAQSIDDSLLNHLAGRWVVTGKIAGHEVIHDVTAEWVLAHQYIQIHEISRAKKSDGKPDYEAIVYVGWNPGLKQYTCLWLDTTGGNGLVADGFGHADKGESTLLFQWNDDRGSQSLENALSYDPTRNTWRWQIDNLANGRVEHFADLKLVRR